MRSSEMPDWLRRTLRTFIQSFSASMLASVSLIVAGTFPELEWWQAALRGALASAALALVTSLLTAAQNGLEEKGAIPSLLKGTGASGPSRPAAPHTGQRGSVRVTSWERMRPPLLVEEDHDARPPPTTPGVSPWSPTPTTTTGGGVTLRPPEPKP